jgi:hypothetical protein
MAGLSPPPARPPPSRRHRQRCHQAKPGWHGDGGGLPSARLQGCGGGICPGPSCRRCDERRRPEIGGRRWWSRQTRSWPFWARSGAQFFDPASSRSLGSFGSTREPVTSYTKLGMVATFFTRGGRLVMAGLVDLDPSSSPSCESGRHICR